MAEPIYRDDKESVSAAIDEQRLINALEANVVEADTIQGSEVSEQRSRNHVYYAGDALGNEKRGRSHHISMDVFDSVESQKAYYLESYYSGHRTMYFDPENDEDTTAHLATEYVDQVFNDDNEGYEFTRDALHDAMVAKKAVAYVRWEEDEEEVIEKLPPMPRQMAGLIQQQGGEIIGEEQVPGPQGLLSQFKVRRYVPASGTVIDLVQPERYFRDPNVSYVRDAAFAGFQEDATRFDLVDRGFDEEEVSNLDLDYRFRQNEEDSARKNHDSSWSRARRHKRPDEMEVVTVYTTFAYLDMDNYMPERKTRDSIAGARLYKFVWSQGRLLTLPENGEKFAEVEDGMPFIEWTQYKIAHADFGLCESDVQVDIQWSKSNLQRLIYDNQAMNNTGRWKARHGFIKNPRELLENNIGSTLFMKDIDRDLAPLPVAPLSNASFQAIESLDQEKEQRSGLSRLAKGLNADAVSKQNADSMIERLTNASNRRVMRGVRDFAETFLKPIFLRTYNLGVKYDEEKRVAEVAGEWIEMTPAQWPERTKCRIEVALTPEQGTEKAMFLLQMDQRLTADPKMAPLYGLEQAHALLDDVCDLMGVGDTSRYMKQPDDPQVQQGLKMQSMMGQKMHQMEMQMQQMTMANQQLQMQLAQSKDRQGWVKTDTDAIYKQAQMMDMREDNELDEERLQLDRDRAAAEYEIERTQQRGAEI